MATFVKAVQAASITVSLLASGSIATMTLFDIPEMQSQPASRSLPMIRWLFSRGSHIMPPAAFFSTAGFSFLAVNSIPQGLSITSILKLTGNNFKVNGYLLAAALNLGIAIWTQQVMIPTNFELIRLNEKLGGTRSAESAQARDEKWQPGSADDSVNGKGQLNQFKDVSGPQTRTDRDSTEEEDEMVRQLLGKFGKLNAVRALLAGAGGVVGLVVALS